MAKYQKYPEYKDSGVEWLGDLPSHWSAKRLGQFFEERREKVSDKDFAALSVTMNGIVPQLDTAAKTDAGDNRKLVRKNDFVINSRSDRKGSSGVSIYDGSVSLISIVMEPRNIVPSYVHHLLRSYPFQEEFYRFGKGIVADLWSTNSSEMKNILVPEVPLSEQIQIAKFLDHETGKIDRLIQKQQQLIALLKEKRQAVISHAVTKGLNPNAPLKPSNIEWLGNVPEHWEILQLRRLLSSIEQGSSPVATNTPPTKGEYGVLKLSAVKKGKFIASEAKTLDEGTPFENKFSLKQGDLLITRGNTPDLVADACVVRKLPSPPLMMSDLIYRLNVNSRVSSEYLCFYLLSSFSRAQIKNDARGSSMSMAKVSQMHIQAWNVVLPSREEQDQLVSAIRDKVCQIDDLVVRTLAQTHLLQERRTALISAAVTGKIDVRDWQQPEEGKSGEEKG